MKKHPATWFLAILVALGAAQSAPLSGFEPCPETCATVKVGKARCEQHVRHERSTRRFANQGSEISPSNDLPTVIRHFCNARLLRAPPLSSIA
jgi:hypothetical protein